ncbi:MAG: trigger factor [Desulfovibrionaceae bacterium]|nr:trigger factor [Desulfovibrionaceae bacterium]MBF0514764.1 trigger factor [Desulfovibrionaceae bacterium]
MQYKATDVSPVAVKVEVTVAAEEASAALTTATMLFKGQADVKGFRKGKVPTEIIEQRFRKQIASEATNDLLNVHINEILGELAITPLSGLEVDAGLLAKGEEFKYSFSFEKAPAFDLPEYAGLSVEEEETVCAPEEIDKVIERIRGNVAELAAVKGDRAAVDGDVAMVSFTAYENGQPVPGVRADNFQLTLGEGQALPEFEALVKSVPSGGQGQGAMTFPADFINESLAGKTVEMHVTVHLVKEKILPPVDDDLAKKAGNFETLAALREAIGKSYEKNRQDLNRAAAQKKLLDELLAKVDFPYPPRMVEHNVGGMFEEFIDRLERQGKNLASLGKTEAEIREEFRPKAMELVKIQIFLLAVAAKESLTVSPGEIDAELKRIAVNSGQDLISVKQMYEERNLVVPLKDRLLADKAMDLIYGKAKIVRVPAKAEEAAV